VTTETNVLSSSPTFTNTSVAVPSYRSGGAAPQGVAAFDDRIFDVAYRSVGGVGHLVAAHQVAGANRKSGPVARWYDINTATMTRIQSGNAPAGVNGAATFMPSVDINTAGSIGMTFDESAKNEFWSMYVTERTASDPAGTMEAAVKVANGVAKTADSRVGDFSGTTVDPSDGLTFWSANEYQGTDFWDTHIASFSIAGAVHTPAKGAVILVNSGAAAPIFQNDTLAASQAAIAASGLFQVPGFPRQTPTPSSTIGRSGTLATAALARGSVGATDRAFAALGGADVRIGASTLASGKDASAGGLLDGVNFEAL
jgi:hypothetical protein